MGTSVFASRGGAAVTRDASPRVSARASPPAASTEAKTAKDARTTARVDFWAMRDAAHGLADFGARAGRPGGTVTIDTPGAESSAETEWGPYGAAHLRAAPHASA